MKSKKFEKCFCIGSNKTGTTSLTKAMAKFNVKICPERDSYVLWRSLNKSRKNVISSEWRYLIEKYFFFQDLPFCYSDIYKELEKNIKKSCFILTTRDSEEWFNSIERWCATHGKSYYDVYGKIWNIEINNKNKQEIIEKYEKRNNQIQEYFQNKDNLLISDIKDMSYEKITQFLQTGDKIGDTFPWENKNYFGEKDE